MFSPTHGSASHFPQHPAFFSRPGACRCPSWLTPYSSCWMRWPLDLRPGFTSGPETSMPTPAVLSGTANGQPSTPSAECSCLQVAEACPLRSLRTVKRARLGGVDATKHMKHGRLERMHPKIVHEEPLFTLRITLASAHQARTCEVIGAPPTISSGSGQLSHQKPSLLLAARSATRPFNASLLTFCLPRSVSIHNPHKKTSNTRVTPHAIMGEAINIRMNKSFMSPSGAPSQLLRLMPVLESSF